MNIRNQITPIKREEIEAKEKAFKRHIKECPHLFNEIRNTIMNTTFFEQPFLGALKLTWLAEIEMDYPIHSASASALFKYKLPGIINLKEWKKTSAQPV